MIRYLTEEWSEMVIWSAPHGPVPKWRFIEHSVVGNRNFNVLPIYITYFRCLVYYKRRYTKVHIHYLPTF